MPTSVRLFSHRILLPPKIAWMSWQQQGAARGSRAIFVNCHTSQRLCSSEDSSATNPNMTLSAARELLGLNERPLKEIITSRDLRLAYYQAAKECHPDTSAGMKKSFNYNEDATEQFRLVTEAYEVLQQQQHRSQDDDESLLDEGYFNAHSIAEYRKACLQWLGQPAEVVEESKRCPVFRQWLSGRTDSAYYWNLFFMLHGGLAPRILPRQLLMKNATKSLDEQQLARAWPKYQRRKRPSCR